MTTGIQHLTRHLLPVISVGLLLAIGVIVTPGMNIAGRMLDHAPPKPAAIHSGRQVQREAIRQHPASTPLTARAPGQVSAPAPIQSWVDTTPTRTAQ